MPTTKCGNNHPDAHQSRHPKVCWRQDEIETAIEKELDAIRLPEILTPLLDLTDSQVIEMGPQLQVAWPMAWSCLMGQSKPCRICQACRRRHAAFEAAGVPDPLPQNPDLA